MKPKFVVIIKLQELVDVNLSSFLVSKGFLEIILKIYFNINPFNYYMNYHRIFLSVNLMFKYNVTLLLNFIQKIVTKRF